MSSRADATFKGRLLKLAITLAALGPLLFCVHEASAQDKPRPSARKFDEFGDILHSDLIARLDNFAIQIQQEPNVRGFIIVYRSRRDLPGLSNRLALISKDYLTSSRGLPKERIVTVDGGAAACLTQELWIVEPGAAPTPRADAYSRSYRSTSVARKFDEFYYPLREDNMELTDGMSIGDSPEALEGFATALREQPRARAYVIAYKQHHPEGRTDSPGTARRMLQAVKEKLVKVYGIPASRITVADGGYRVLRELELWIVPRGVRVPVATPNVFPRKRRAPFTAQGKKFDKGARAQLYSGADAASLF